MAKVRFILSCTGCASAMQMCAQCTTAFVGYLERKHVCEPDKSARVTGKSLIITALSADNLSEGPRRNV